MATSFSTDVLRRVAHDVKNPLTAVRVLADLMAEDASGALRDDLRDLVAAIDVAVVQTEGLSAWAQALDGASVEGARSPLLGVVQEVASREAFASVVVEGTSTLEVPRTWMRRALTSLLASSTQVTRGQVAVVVEGTTLHVQHAGVGLTDAQIASLFTVAPTSRIVRSSAFGLWGARDLLAAGGARLDVVSQDPFELRVTLG